jgi:hypothetical protein
MLLADRRVGSNGSCVGPMRVLTAGSCASGVDVRTVM